MTNPKHGRALVDALPRAEFVEIAGAGHMLMAEAPQAITEVAKPVMVWAAISAHFCVGAVMMMRVPTMGKASANVSTISTPLIFNLVMTPFGTDLWRDGG